MPTPFWLGCSPVSRLTTDYPTYRVLIQFYCIHTCIDSSFPVLISHGHLDHVYVGTGRGFDDAHFGVADFQMRQAALTQKIHAQGSAPGICRAWASGGIAGIAPSMAMKSWVKFAFEPWEHLGANIPGTIFWVCWPPRFDSSWGVSQRERLYLHANVWCGKFLFLGFKRHAAREDQKGLLSLMPASMRPQSSTARWIKIWGRHCT